MKKVILSLFLFLATMGMSLAQVGYIDYTYIYQNNATAKKFKSQLAVKSSEIKKYNQTTKNLMAAKKTPEEKIQVRDSRAQGLLKMSSEYTTLRKQMDSVMLAKVKTASDIVLAQKKLDAIFDKRYMVTGGIDCTQDVFRAIK